MWRILEIDEQRVKVEPMDSATGEIPSWVGEQIPVPYEVASDVGKLRGRIANSSEAASHSLLKDYCTDPYTVERVVNLMRRQEKFVVPTHNVLVVEVDGKTALIHACFGHRINETLGRVISSLLA